MQAPLQFQKIIDGTDGILYVAETNNQIPFPIKRIYFIDSLSQTSARGYHAHKKTEQVIFVLRGSFHLTMYDGKVISIHKLNLGEMIPIPALAWHFMSDFSKDCLIGVVASHEYDEKDYIRSFHEFKKAVQ